jgi:hypothetical protein
MSSSPWERLLNGDEDVATPSGLWMEGANSDVAGRGVGGLFWTAVGTLSRPKR